MKEKLLFTIVFLLFIISFFNSTTYAARVQASISISNYGLGAGLVETGRGEGLSLYLNKSIRGENRYTRAGLRYYTDINHYSYYWSVGYVGHQRKNVYRSALDAGVGVEVALFEGGQIAFETGYSTAVSGNIFYGLRLELNFN